MSNVNSAKFILAHLPQNRLSSFELHFPPFSVLFNSRDTIFLVTWAVLLVYTIDLSVRNSKSDSGSEFEYACPNHVFEFSIASRRSSVYVCVVAIVRECRGGAEFERRAGVVGEGE